MSSLSVFAVTMMTVSSSGECVLRSARSTSMPFMPGIMMSRRTTSTRSRLTISSACGPLSAVSTR